MIEREYKFLLTENKFSAILERAKGLYGKPKEKTQQNHYYDNETLSLNSCGVTVRLRQANGIGKLQIKRHNGETNGYAVSEETEQSIEGIPTEIVLPEFGLLRLKGGLTTHRCSFFVCENISLDMDENTYLGLTDYEAEIEFDDNAQNRAERIMLAMGLDTANRENKSARFFSAFERTEFYEV